MSKKPLSLALSLCLGFSLLAACGPGPNDPMSATPVAASQPGAKASLSLEQRARAALASYHDVDATFADTQRLSAKGGFKTKLLNLDDEDDADTSLSSSLGATVDAVSDVSLDAGDTSLDAGADLNADVDAAVDAAADAAADVSADLSADVNAAASAASSGNVSATADATANAAVNATANASSSTSSNLSSNVGANLNGSLNTGNSSASTNVGSTLTSNLSSSLTGGSSGNGSLTGNLTSGLSSSLDANAMLNAFDDEAINEASLESSLNSALSSNTSLLNSTSSSAMADIAANSLVRLSGRDFDSSTASASSTTNADGSVTSHLSANFTSDLSTRRVSLSSQSNGDVQLGTDFALNESGEGWTRTALRSIDVQADGSLHVMTKLTTNFANGDVLEIFEDRELNAQGSGTGHGSFSLSSDGGASIDGELRTTVNADGSFNSFLDLENGSDLMLHESANGQLSFNTRANGGGWANTWTSLDLDATLEAFLNAEA